MVVKYPPLSPRTTEVLEGLLAGRTRREIAADLHLSPHTIGHHVALLLHRWRAPTTAVLTATVWAERHAALEAENARLRATVAVLDRRRGG